MSAIPRSPLTGILLCLIAATSFACNTALASIAYKHGATPLSVLTYRIALAVVALYVVLKMQGIAIRLPPRQRNHALALDIGAGTLNPIGFAHALGGAILITVLVLFNARMVGTGDSRPVSLHMLFTGFLSYALCDILLGEFPLPQDAIGWAAFLGVGIFYSFSIVSMFVAISWIGTVRTALIMNLEPITSVFLGIVLLGQPMSWSQLLGAAIVVGAIVFTAWHKMRPQRMAPI
jgi:drug/metabolite transporter (DMT)-like permease